MSLVRLNTLSAWPEAGPLLAMALEGTNETHLDLRRACLRGEAYLLGSDRMFLVVKPQPTADGFELLICAAASRGATDCIKEHLPDVEELAKKMGAKGAVMVTNRNGFHRAMGPNWKPRCYVMERTF